MRILFLAKRSSATSPKWIDQEGLGKRRTGTLGTRQARTEELQK